MKLYVSIVDTKAHYSDGQFRALIETWAFATRSPVRGTFANCSALARRVGQEHVDFLIEQGDLIADPDGSLTVYRWGEYQAGVLSTDRKKPAGDGGDPVGSSGTVPDQFESSSLVRARDAGLLSTLYEEDTNEEEVSPAGAREAIPTGFDGADPFDAFYLTTNEYPNSPKLKRWIVDVASKGPSPRDFGVVFHAEFAANGRDMKAAMKSTEAKLSKMADRAASAKAKEPPKLNALQSEIKRAMLARDAAIAAGELPGPTNGTNGHRPLAGAVAGVVASLQGAPATGLSLTVDGGSDRESTAVPPRGG